MQIKFYVMCAQVCTFAAFLACTITGFMEWKPINLMVAGALLTEILVFSVAFCCSCQREDRYDGEEDKGWTLCCEASATGFLAGTGLVLGYLVGPFIIICGFVYDKDMDIIAGSVVTGVMAVVTTAILISMWSRGSQPISPV